jgi:predicted RNA-binding Zn ribbon-like protein
VAVSRRVKRTFRDPSAPAPGGLELVRSFLNTSTAEFDYEELADVETTSAWLHDMGLLPHTERPTEAERRELVALRADLRALADANRRGVAPGRQAARLSERFRAGPLVVALDEGGQVVLRPAGPAAAVGALAAAVATAVLDGTWPSMKVCRECEWAFYDRSRNRSGQWCAMRVCGSRVKTRAYRARRSRGWDAQ